VPFWLDTPGIGLYNPRTFRQAVSFFQSARRMRASTSKAQTLPLTAKLSDLGA